MARATDIIGYTYRADQYTPEGVIAALPTGPGQAFDGWALGDGVHMTVEENLDQIAAAFRIDRMDERSFDSDDFPKVIFLYQVEDGETFIDEHGDYLSLEDII